eukprot:TRINITY_DN30469_c0_g1_i1.p1 TRINITY_DN30469_c0_g1~~TRINITY_DN30469_c0_g1_i1.p1  ORF type:complete len:719 (-),score=153.56 TRINITY_DN30469_c0_g1_i1:203-2359(-)
MSSESLQELQDQLGRAENCLLEIQPKAASSCSRAADATTAAEEKVSHTRKLEAELQDWLRQAGAASSEAAASEARLNAILDKASSELQALSKRQLDEVRSLPYPPRVVQRSLALVYCLLRPQDTQRFVALGGVPWKEKLAPMLKKDNLVQQMMAFPPPQEKHPLIAYPELRNLIESQVEASEPKEMATSNSTAFDATDFATTITSSGLSTPRPRDADNQSTPPFSPTKEKPRSPMQSAASLVLKRQSVRAATLGNMKLPDDTASNDVKSLVGIIEAKRAATKLLSRTRSSAKLFEGERLTIDAVAFASSAMGAIFRWLLAQLRYVRILEEHDLLGCEGKAAVARLQKDELQARIAELESLVAEARAQAGSAEDLAADANSEAARLTDEVDELMRKIAELRQRIENRHCDEAVRLSQLAAAAEAERRRKAEEQRREEERRQEEVRMCQEEKRREEEAKRLEEQRREEARRHEEQQRLKEEQQRRFKDLHGFEDRIKDWKNYVKMPPAKVVIEKQIMFEAGSAEMQSGGKSNIDHIAEVMRANAEVKVSVHGRTRAEESSSLCLARAKHVVEALVGQGISRHRLRATGDAPGHRRAQEASVDFAVISELSIAGTIQFSPCSDRLMSDSTKLVDGVAGFLLAEPSLRLRVEGHTDNSPNWGCSNQELSADRAQSVVRHLAELGVDDSRMEAVGYGDTLPRVSNSSREGRAQNRRVEFHVLR